MQYRPAQSHRAWWFPAVALAVVAAMTWAPVVAAGVTAAGSDATQEAAPFSSGLDNVTPAAKFDATEAAPDSGSLEAALSKRSAPLPVAIQATPIAQGSSANGPQTSSSDTQNDPAKSSSRPASPSASSAKARTTSAQPSSSNTSQSNASTSKNSASPSTGGQLAQAQSILASLIRAHPVLAGVTVSIGSTPGGYQAVAYYKSGRILVSPKHTTSLERILRHEIWHVIDWRDNHRIDWGENVPPR